MKKWNVRKLIKYYIAQESINNTCFPVAVVNACIYKNHGTAAPDVHTLMGIALCQDGPTIAEEKCIEYAGLKMTFTNDWRLVLEKSGILTIMHPIYNLHSVLCIKENKGVLGITFSEEHTYTLVNSWLGPNVITDISAVEIEKFMAGEEGNINRNGWYFG